MELFFAPGACFTCLCDCPWRPIQKFWFFQKHAESSAYPDQDRRQVHRPVSRQGRRVPISEESGLDHTQDEKYYAFFNNPAKQSDLVRRGEPVTTFVQQDVNGF